MPKIRPLAERFWEKVAKRSADECWEWTACRNANGYGTIGSGGRKGRAVLAHRVSYEIHFSPIPGGLCVLHSCDNPSCVNPAHLHLGTNFDNVQEAIERNLRWVHLGSKAGTAKLTEDDVRSIRLEYSQDPTSSLKSLAIKYGVSDPAIRMILTGKGWKHVGDSPAYVPKTSRLNSLKGSQVHAAKLTEEQVREIRLKRSVGGYSVRQLSAEYGLTIGTIGNIIRRYTWKHVT